MDEALVERGGMGGLVPYLDQNGLVTPTYRLYEFWQSAFSDTADESISYRQMARHIPDPDPCLTKAHEAPPEVFHSQGQPKFQNDFEETKKKRLKEWRHETVPNPSQLTQFLQSISGEERDAFLPFLMTRAATAWTKWIQHEGEVLTRSTSETPDLALHIDLAWLLQVFARYQEYWDRARAHPQSSEPGS